MSESYRPKGLSSSVFYQDARAALPWLERAFGFEQAFVLLDGDGKVAHSEMTYGVSTIAIGNEWGEVHRSPASVGGMNTQSIHVQLDAGEDLDGHCEQARAAGAAIVQEPEDQFYGERTYRARDPEGHVWTFSVTVNKMTSDEWDAAGGFTTVTRIDPAG